MSLNNGQKTNTNPSTTSIKPPVNPSLTANTGFYSRHGQYNGGRNAMANNHRFSPSTSPGFTSK